MRWTAPNADKPHRCPGCHQIPARLRRPHGPRTAAVCVACGLKWRAGYRHTLGYYRYVYRLNQSMALYPLARVYRDRIEKERHAA